MIEAQKKLLRKREGRLQRYSVGNDALVRSHVKWKGYEDEYAHPYQRAFQNTGK